MIDLKRSGYRVRRETLIGEAKSGWVRRSPESKAQAQNPIFPKHPGHSVFFIWPLRQLVARQAVASKLPAATAGRRLNATPYSNVGTRRPESASA
ncbi:hypothetical protein KM539_12965 [Xanthomonas translucens pv. poae]|uniref:hypothetical protein n=1 Tax=Xanthomonas graminis TaxID=3390026 RepID=UPI000AF18B25|nr:hypothetical protein [Xanthomonas translucens]UKE60737.1 hypothetical protein KM539_12965 [Xanthomonas translucens pv. poae]